MKKPIFASICFLFLLYGPAIFAQDRAVKGTVSDEKGPLQGVTIYIKSKLTTTLSDAKGNFSINASIGDTLQLTHAGYQLHEILVDSRTDYNITMTAEPQSLEGVVVVGYGTRKRQHLTGSVAVVGQEAIASRPVTNTLSALQGQIAGVVVQRSTGQPGAEGFELNVRGFSSTNGGNSPLVLIDGVAGSLDLLNPDDIESVTTLKDAAASIYGARAAGGVLLVTTKRGKKGQTRVNYSGNAAVTKLSGMMETPNHYQFAIMDNEANIHNNSAPFYTAEYLEKIRNNDPNPIAHPNGFGGWLLFFTSTDWREALFTNGFLQKHTVNISGGGDKSTYYISGSYFNQEGVIKYANDANSRYNLRMNYDYDFSKRIRLETKISFENQRRTDVGGVGSYIITEGIFGMPNHPVYTQSGQHYFAQGGWGNAVAMAREGETSNFDNRNINTNFKLIGTILPGLRVNLQTGINYGYARNKDIANSFPLYTWDESSIVYYSIANPQQTRVSMYNAESTYRNFTGYVEFDRTFAGRHHIDVMAGASQEESDFDWFSASRDNFSNDDVWSINLGSTANMQNDGGGSHWAIRSFFSRIGYVFANKYMLEANLRYDGSSRFHPDTRWGLFPGISAGWRLSQEKFISDLKIFDDLKLRVSYGETGNQEGINLYDYYQLITIGKSYPFGPGLQSQSAYSDTIVSLDRTWETLVNRNIGLDATLLSSRLSFSFDYFIKTNRDMLIPVTYPALLGAIPPFSNSGELKTWGFETSIAWKDKIGKLEYSARVILGDARNEVTDYGGNDFYVQGLNFVREGFPVNTYFAYFFDGVIRSQHELDEYKNLGGVPGDISIGDAKFKDVNGDGVLDPSDFIDAGNTSPRYNYGINLGAKYKNFDLNLFIQGVGKRTLFREGEYSMPWSDWWRQPPTFYYGKTWNEDRPDAPYPRLSHGDIRWWNYQKSTLQKINAAYMRMKNIQIGYTFPARLLSKVSIANARIYLSGENLFEFHDVPGGWDPESSMYGFNYPFQRTFSAGIDLTF